LGSGATGIERSMLFPPANSKEAHATICKSGTNQPLPMEIDEDDKGTHFTVSLGNVVHDFVLKQVLPCLFHVRPAGHAKHFLKSFMCSKERVDDGTFTKLLLSEFSPKENMVVQYRDDSNELRTISTQESLEEAFSQVRY
jgi:hypothetical protein